MNSLDTKRWKRGKIHGSIVVALQVYLLFVCVTINAADVATFPINYLMPYFAAPVFHSMVLINYRNWD